MSIIGNHLGFMSASQVLGPTTFNSADQGVGITLSGGDLIASNSLSSQWRSVRATRGRSSGKYVFELKFSSSTTSLAAGFANGSASMASFLGNTSTSFSLQGGGGGYKKSGVTTFGTAPASSTNPYMFALDMDAGKGWIGLGDVWANSGDPAAGTNPSFTWTAGTTIYPGASVFTVGGITVTLNAGASAFSNTVPSGFNAGWD